MESSGQNLTNDQLCEELQKLQRQFSTATDEHPAVIELRHQTILNTGDEEDLEVLIIVDDNTPLEKTGWTYIEPIENAVRQSLQKLGENRFVFFSVGTKQDAEQWSLPVEDIEDDAAA